MGRAGARRKRESRSAKDGLIRIDRPATPADSPCPQRTPGPGFAVYLHHVVSIIPFPFSAHSLKTPFSERKPKGEKKTREKRRVQKGREERERGRKERKKNARISCRLTNGCFSHVCNNLPPCEVLHLLSTPKSVLFSPPPYYSLLSVSFPSKFLEKDEQARVGGHRTKGYDGVRKGQKTHRMGRLRDEVERAQGGGVELHVLPKCVRVQGVFS
jgi:hypothetical protein